MKRNVPQRQPEYTIQKFQTTEEWKAARPLGIGSSEVGAIMGVSQWASPYDVWCQKLGLVDPIPENFQMEMGHAMEPWVAAQFSLNTGIKIIKASEGDWLAIDNEKQYLRVSPDRTYWIPGMKHNDYNKGIAECKTSYHEYEEDALFTDCMYWFCQLQYQLHVLRYQEGYLCYMCLDKFGQGKRWFRHVPYDKEFCEGTMIPALDKFWHRHILPAQQFLRAHNITDPRTLSPEYWDAIHEFAPPVTSADDVTRRYRHQTEGKEVSIEGVTIPETIAAPGVDTFDDMLNKYRQVTRQLKELDTLKRSIEDVVKLYMQDAETLTSPDGSVIATYRQNKASTKFDTKALQAAYPDIYNEFTRSAPGARILRFKN